MDRLVEGEFPIHFGTLHYRDFSGIDDLSRFFFKVGWRIDSCIGLGKTGIFKHCHFEVVGLLIFKNDVIISIRFDFGDEGRKYGLVEADVHGKLLHLLSSLHHHHC